MNTLKLLFLTVLVGLTSAFDYKLTAGGKLVLTDVKTKITPILTLFTDETTLVTVDGIEWEMANNTANSSDVLVWKTFVDGKLQAQGNVSLADVGRTLLTTFDAGEIVVTDRGTSTIEVFMTVDSSETSASGYYQAYAPGVAIIPIIVVLLMAATTRMVELSLIAVVFIGACMIKGTVNSGFKATLDTHLLEAMADSDHVKVYLFTFFLSGLVGVIERSGGMAGFGRDVGSLASSSRRGQLACFLIGILIFFDDYTSCLLVGQTMRPLLDMVNVSREKLCFIVDATAAPIASISPVSSWVGFEIDLIQTEIDRIIALHPNSKIFINTSGMGVFLQSVKYRYYPIFMLVLMLVLLSSKRDFAGMLIAERKTHVYRRTDGGDGKVNRGGGSYGEPIHNQPHKDTPLRSYNMFLPIGLLVFFIFYLLVETGVRDGVDQDLLDKIQKADSYSALLWGTMAATLCTFIFYSIQFVQGGEMVSPTMSVLRQAFTFRKAKLDDDDEEIAEDKVSNKPRLLMSVLELFESFIYGMGRVFPASIILTLAWASGGIMTGVGADRLFSRWIVGGLDPALLPTLSFLISFFMALATGTSWGTMSILFPLLLVPTYDAVNGDEVVFYAVVAGVLSGSVAGDHVSPISDTTVLSALSTDCRLIPHVNTQYPYGFAVIIVSTIVGTIPIGHSTWPNIVGILLGVLVIILFAYFGCAPVISATGRYDPITELILKIKGEEASLIKLREDTVKAYNGVDLSKEGKTAALESGTEDPSNDPSHVPREQSTVQDTEHAVEHAQSLFKGTL